MASTSSLDRPRRPETALPAGQVREKAAPPPGPTGLPGTGLPIQLPDPLTETQSGVTARSFASAEPLTPASTRPVGQAAVNAVPSLPVPNAGVQSVPTRALERGPPIPAWPPTA